ncbi:hypothetical protein SAMN05444920_110216 [Nonomuraea solani]|uniref:Uncharacterized protein n=1 Tax=Nonomuraea solani TaxID=1144553 RepID=A0A1H6EJR9_9ACTN|nr:hypothetical protein [Nonomuraea solani]SEG97109.1 hypothetical protein SAMN05444920_110216 [Nonomuraea solani]
MTVQDLRDVLRERADGPSPANPNRHDQVRGRIRRIRLRRSALAGGAAVAAVAVVFSLLPGAAGPPERDTTVVAAPPVSELPERFTSQDGTEYRRLTTARLTRKGARKVSVTVPVSGLPLDAAGLCDGTFGTNGPRILVDGEDHRVAGFAPCPKGMDLRPLIVPDGAKEITVTFDTTTSGCVKETKGGPCLPPRPRLADWDLAIYEWTPPARQVTPEPLKEMPERLGGKRLAFATDSVWPKDSLYQMRVESASGRIGIDQICSGDLAGRLWFTYTIDGEETGSTSGCGVWKSGPFPMAMTEHKIPKGKKVDITVQVGLHGGHTNRPVRYAIGIYRG